MCSWSNYGGGYAEKHEHSEQPVDLEDELSVGWCVGEGPGPLSVLAEEEEEEKMMMAQTKKESFAHLTT